MILVQIFFFIIFSSVSILSIVGLGQLINTNKNNEFINNFFWIDCSIFFDHLITFFCENKSHSNNFNTH